MSDERNKEIVKRWIVGIWDRGDFRLMEEIGSEAYAFTTPSDGEMRGEGFRDFVTAVRSAFPDLNNTIESQVSDGDIVVTRGTTRGTHEGAFGEIGATGKPVAIPWVMYTRIQDGRILEDWELYDALGMMKQLGVV